MEQRLLLVLGVIFVLSLVGAFVLFRFLQSTAIVERKGYQAGGALAGFLLVFGALYGAYSQLERSAMEREAAIQTWTIVGEVSLERDPKNAEEVEVTLMPPPPKTMSVAGGKFRFDRIGIPSSEPPELRFEMQGYLPELLLLNEEVAEFDRETRRITLKDPVKLALASELPPIRDTGTAPPPMPPPPPAQPQLAMMSGQVLKARS